MARLNDVMTFKGRQRNNGDRVEAEILRETCVRKRYLVTH
jgi:hypothetical protein